MLANRPSTLHRQACTGGVARRLKTTGQPPRELFIAICGKAADRSKTGPATARYRRYAGAARGRHGPPGQASPSQIADRKSRPGGRRLPVPADPVVALPEQLEHDWDAVTLALRREVTDFTFHIWLEPLAPAGRVRGTLFVRAPDHIRTWVEDSFLPVLRKAASQAIGASEVEIVDGRWEAPAS